MIKSFCSLRPNLSFTVKASKNWNANSGFTTASICRCSFSLSFSFSIATSCCLRFETVHFDCPQLDKLCSCVYAAALICSVTSIRISSLSYACLCTSVNVCMCVCVQRFVSQDFVPPEFQHLVLSGARLRPSLMVKLLL